MYLVQEWHVYENKSSDLDAFVELIAGTKDWIVGINRHSFVADDIQTLKLFANLSPDEDMAETFVSFVRESKPTDNTQRDKKVLFFYQYPDFVTLRSELLTNLAGKNVLY
jgi:hypothetical protein